MKETKRRKSVIAALNRGSFVKIYASATREEFTLVYPGGQGCKRVRQSFADFNEAKAERDRVLVRFKNRDTLALSLTSRDNDSYLAAKEELAGLNLTVPAAVREYREARDLTQGKFTILEAVRYFASHGVADVPEKTAKEVLAEMLAAMEKDNPAGHFNRKNLRRYGRRFAEKFPGPVAKMRNLEIDAWLRTLDCSPKTRNHVAGAVGTLFTFARRCGYLPTDSDAGKNLSRAKVVQRETQVYKPAQVDAMLRKMQAVAPKYVPALAIAAFAGLRTAELKRLDWQDVRFDIGVIEVKAVNAKTGARRPVPILPNLLAWLMPFKGSTGLVMGTVKKADVMMQRVMQEARTDGDGKVWEPLKWLKNGFRHSFASYRLQSTQNAPQTAFECGHDAAMLNKHYRQLVTSADAEAYGKITPEPSLAIVAQFIAAAA